MRINPGIHVLEVSPGALQLGIGSGSLLLRNLQAADIGFLAALRSGVPDGTEPATAAELSLPAERTASLLEVLDPLLVPFGGPAAPVPSLRSERLQPDAQRISSAYGVNGEQTVRHRSSATVSVEGLGRTGALLARTLATAGIGRLLLADPGLVAPDDVGPAYAMTDIGMNRAAATKRHIFRVDPTLQVLPVTGDGREAAAGTVDLAVTVRAVGAMQREQEAGTGAPVPRLVLTAQEGGWDVGPLVVPGVTPCLECLDRYRADTDPGWYAAVEALGRQDRPTTRTAGTTDAGGGQRAGDPAPEVCGWPDGEETAGAVLAAGTAAMAALVFLDGVNQPALLSSVLSLRASDGYPRLQKLDFHPSCGCRLQHRSPRVA